MPLRYSQIQYMGCPCIVCSLILLRGVNSKKNGRTELTITPDRLLSSPLLNKKPPWGLEHNISLESSTPFVLRRDVVGWRSIKRWTVTWVGGVKFKHPIDAFIWNAGEVGDVKKFSELIIIRDVPRRQGEYRSLIVHVSFRAWSLVVNWRKHNLVFDQCLPITMGILATMPFCTNLCGLSARRSPSALGTQVRLSEVYE